MQNSGSQRPDLHDGHRSSNPPRPGCTGATPGSIKPPTAPVTSKPPTGAAITELVDKNVDKASTSRQPVDKVAAGKLLGKIFDEIFEGATSAISPLGP